MAGMLTRRGGATPSDTHPSIEITGWLKPCRQPRSRVGWLIGPPTPSHPLPPRSGSLVWLSQPVTPIEGWVVDGDAPDIPAGILQFGGVRAALVGHPTFYGGRLSV
ncbi:hypothetical protein CRG98_028198 [Punica granatum]|uniref:Uncharacterized protein n=1 Tax=Punica granatum TaxID=22663 RepID=A0A2I0J594_PUNGR|nr:hypothetical protein CRG98_028198 [Punica granatum]